MTNIVDPAQIMDRVADQTLALIAGADGVLIGLREDRGVSYVCGAGSLASYAGTRVRFDASLAGLALRTGQVVHSADLQADNRADTQAARRLGVASSVCVPLVRGSEPLGVMAVSASRRDAFCDDDVAVLTRLADFVSVAIGVAGDLARASAGVLAPVDVGDRTAAGLAAEANFMLGVLSPEDASRLDARERIEQVLGCPTSLSMVYQPIVEVATGEVRAFEALARFAPEPRRPPDVWFAEAHQVGLGAELELLAVRRALACLPALPAEIALTVNAGPETIASSELAEVLQDVGPRVILELTEHAQVDDYPALVQTLRSLRGAGVRLAVDDTGAGFSSLAHTLKLAPDFMKLDRDLITGIDFDPVRRALSASLLGFANDTGASIIAEGVETEAELDTVHRLGLPYAQGFYLGRPAPLGAHRGHAHQRFAIATGLEPAADNPHVVASG